MTIFSCFLFPPFLQDELKLKNLKERLLIQINKPPSTTTYSFTYDFNTTVKAALLSLLKDSPNSQSERFGLYYPMRGIWLEEGKTLEFYEIDSSVGVHPLPPLAFIV